MHPRDMFLAEKGTLALDSVDHEFALAWYRRGVMAEREACAKVCDLLASENRCNADCTLYSENYAHECDRRAAAIRMRSNG